MSKSPRLNFRFRLGYGISVALMATVLLSALVSPHTVPNKSTSDRYGTCTCTLYRSTGTGTCSTSTSTSTAMVVLVPVLVIVQVFYGTGSTRTVPTLQHILLHYHDVVHPVFVKRASALLPYRQHRSAYMIVGIAMQHPTGEALPSLDHAGEQASTMETGESGKYEETNSIPMLGQQGSSYQRIEHVNHKGTIPIMLSVMNGATPPAHIYVSDTMAMEERLHQQQMIGQLETQFGQFGLHDQGNSDHFDSSGNNSNSDNNLVEDIEGEEMDEEPVKLFVGQVRFVQVYFCNNQLGY